MNKKPRKCGVGGQTGDVQMKKIEGESNVRSIADRTDWIEDAALGVAVREAGDELHVKSSDREGRGHAAIARAVMAAYAPGGMGTGIGDGYLVVDAAHRLAFARALYPLTRAGCTSLASAIAHQECVGAGMTTQRTPGPWALQPFGRGAMVVAGTGIEQRLITECRAGSGAELSSTEANAAFIVQACNAHDDLVAACEAICELENDSLPASIALSIKYRVMPIVRAALAKAGEGTLNPRSAVQS